MNTRRCLVALLCCAVILTGLGSFARAVPIHPTNKQKKGPGEVIVTGTNPDADQVEVALSGSLSITVRIEGAASMQVEPVQAVTASNQWKERRRQSPLEKQSDDRKLWEQEFALEPQRVGEVLLSLAPLRYRENANESWQTIVWDPIPVKVTTEITQADPKELRDIPPPESESRSGGDHLWLGWAVGGLILAAVGVAGWAFNRRLQRGKPPVSPERWAMKELDRIRGMGLADDNYGIKQHALVSDVLRRYLELRFQLKAPGKTTMELLATLQQGGHLTAPQFAVLRDALDRSDLAKFARVCPTSEECSQLDNLVRTLISETTDRDHTSPQR
jgi:hypothetical protein